MNNYSKQREIILEVIKNNRTHPTAEEIYILVTKKEPKISRSTVYRNINILVEKGIIEKITIATGPDRYDYLSLLAAFFTVKCQVYLSADPRVGGGVDLLRLSKGRGFPV